MENELKLGSVVKLKSSESHHPYMTYGGLSSSGKAIVYWFLSGELKEGMVTPECLEVVK